MRARLFDENLPSPTAIWTEIVKERDYRLVRDAILYAEAVTVELCNVVDVADGSLSWGEYVRKASSEYCETIRRGVRRCLS